MAIANAKYSGLKEVGNTGNIQRPSIFKKIFISGEPREGQDVGKMHSLIDFDTQVYLMQNISKFNFIPLFLKKIREAYNDENKNYPKLTYFSWNPDQDTNFPDEARCAYVFAGAAFDEAMKPIPRHDDPTKTALVFFKCEGIKVGSMIDFLNLVKDKVSKISPISDDPDFEKSVISWRRFMVQVTVTTKKSNYGNKYVFQFVPSQQIGDEKVETFLKQSEGLLEQFKSQFDLTGNMSNSSKKYEEAGMKKLDSKEEKQVTKEQEKEISVNTQELNNLDLGL